MKKVLILQNETEQHAYANLTDLCKDFSQFSYHYIKRQKYPFRYKGFDFIKLEIKR